MYPTNNDDYMYSWLKIFGETGPSRQNNSIGADQTALHYENMPIQIY